MLGFVHQGLWAQCLCIYAGPEALEDTGDSQNDAAGDIERFRLSCETVEQAARRQAVWDESTVAKLEDYLRGRAIVSFSYSADESLGL